MKEKTGKSGNKMTSKLKQKKGIPINSIVIKPTILMLDYDSIYLSKFVSNFMTRYKKAKYVLHFKIILVNIFKTRRGYHIELTLNKKISPYEICFYQLLFCSDFMRECLNIRRVRLKIKNWNILYNGKYDKKNKTFYYRKRLSFESNRLFQLIEIEDISKEIENISS